MGKQRVQYRESTEGSAKWAAGHKAGCVLFAPDDECICDEFQDDADAEIFAAEEAGAQRSSMQMVGCGCLIVLAALLGAALLATCVTIDRAFGRDSEAVAAYSVCEMCGALLDETNAHARCAWEVAHADLR